ncbi:MAG: acyltransferase family protein [Chitinophagaceae bacterium]
MKNRIGVIDGLRAFAVLGVMWAHTWAFFGNLSLKISKVDINQLISFGGIGVDLFFVISGFCMYLMYVKKSDHFSVKSFLDFIKKRALRIIPAYYLLLFVEMVILYLLYKSFNVDALIKHMLFLGFLDHSQSISPHYWSLATEWQYYLILPFIFGCFNKKVSIKNKIVICCFLSILCRLFLFHSNIHLLEISETVTSDFIIYRFVEFGIGMLTAMYFINNDKAPSFLTGEKGFLISLAIAFVGRTMMSAVLYQKIPQINYIVKTFAEPVLCVGFAFMCINLLYSTKSIFTKLIESKIVTFLGKISYSMYLWHWLICTHISAWFLKRSFNNNLFFEIAFLATTLITIALSIVTYQNIELRYFKKNNYIKPA